MNGTVFDFTPGFTVSVLSRSRPGKGHDAWFVGHDGAAVVDGATPLGPDYPDDLPAFARSAARHLGSDRFEGIEQLHTGAIQKISQQFEPAGHRRTAATGVVRQDGSALHCAVLGDCRILVGMNTGVVDVFDATLTKLEAADRRSGQPRRAASISRRNRVFTEQLYQIFGDQMSAAVPKVGVTLALRDAHTVILMSDGAWNALPQDPADMLACLSAGDLPALFDAAIEQPVNDDATIIRLERFP